MEPGTESIRGRACTRNRPDSLADNGIADRIADRIAADAGADTSHAINALGEAIAGLRGQLEVANGQAEAEAERQRADRAEAAQHELRLDLARMEEQLRQAEIDRLVAVAAERSWLLRWRRR